MNERLAERNIEPLIEAVESAIKETIPQAAEYKDLWIKQVVLHPSLDAIKREERRVRPIQPLLIPKALISAGFSQEAIDNNHYRASPVNPLFADYTKQSFYMTETSAMALAAAHPGTRLEAGVMIGLELINANIRSIAYGLYPQIQGDERSNYWRLMMKTDVIRFAQEQRRLFKTKKAYQDFKDRIDYLFSEKGLNKEGGEIEAVGGLVICRFPGQSSVNPEIRIGTHFDEGTLGLITLPAKLRFASLYFGKDDDNKDDQCIDLTDLLGHSVSQKEAETTLQILGLQRYEVKIKKGVNIRDDAFEAFAFSQLPRLYLESEDPRLNPFKYAQIVEEKDWLRK